MNPEVLTKYLLAFGDLRRMAHAQHGQAPHKPILILALLDEIERGAFVGNLITPTPDLIAGFQTYWKALVASTYWSPTMHNPYRHLYQEGWWHFIRRGESVAPVKYTPSLKFMAEEYDYVRLSPDLWQLLQDRAALNALRNHVLQVYFGKVNLSEVVREAPADYLTAITAKLTAEAKRPFKSVVRESKDETVYLRHALFPRMIRGIYQDACAVCGLATYLPRGGTLLDGAHIIPFNVSHNDDPRNGIALCKNHHWGFDRGWFTVSDKYTLEVSPLLVSGTGYITPGVPLRLPVAPILYPALDALNWHRRNIFKS